MDARHSLRQHYRPARPEPAGRGRRLRQVMEFRCESRSLELRQIEGRFRRWSSRWRFVPASDGDGTTAAMELDFDLGPLGLVIPRRLVNVAIDDIFRHTASAAREQLLSRIEPHASSTISGDAARTVLDALRRGERVVLEIAGRRYRLAPDT